MRSGCALWGLASPPRPHGSVVRFTPILKMKKGGSAAGLQRRASLCPICPFVSSVSLSLLARKPCKCARGKATGTKGVQNTAGGERSVTPGYQGTRQRVPCELGSPRDASRFTGNWRLANGDELAESRSEATGNCSERRLRSSPTFSHFFTSKMPK